MTAVRSSPARAERRLTWYDFVRIRRGRRASFWQANLRSDGRYVRDDEARAVPQSTQSGCGNGATTAVGPVLLPARPARSTSTSAFYDELRERFGAPGDFAQAYVIAHEVGHHVQNLLGIDASRVRRSSARPERANELRCASSSRPTASPACGRIDRRSAACSSRRHRRGARRRGRDRRRPHPDAGQGSVQPETWTHGSAAQRSQWLRTGFSSGDPGMRYVRREHLNRTDDGGGAGRCSLRRALRDS